MIRILVVDDDPSILLTLEANLSEVDGVSVSVANSGSAALEALDKQVFDLVMSDVRMPGMNGVELFRELRRRQAQLPFVLMTAFAMEALLEDAKREGAFAVLPKPFDIEQVLPILMRAASRPVALVVDGSRKDAEEAAASLREIGLRATSAVEEAEIVGAIQGGAADVCVIEVAMAASGDVPLIDRLRKIDPLLSFIAISGHDVPDLMRKIVSGGLVSLLRKPVAPDKLAQSIANARGKSVERK